MNARPIMLALLLCLGAAGCRTIKPATPVLRAWQEYTTPEPSGTLSPEEAQWKSEPQDRVSPPSQQRAAKRAMRRWTEKYLKHQYRVTSEQFVLMESGFTDSARIGSRARRYAEQELGGTRIVNGWFNDGGYGLFLWQAGAASPTYIAFVITDNFLPNTDDQKLVGYFELKAVEPTQDK